MEAKDKVYGCDHCQKTFSIPSKLRRHEAIHVAGKLHICDLCDFNSNYENTILKHRKEKHGIENTEMPIEETIAMSEEFGQKKLKNGNAQCDFCQYSTPRKDHVIRHIKNVHFGLRKPIKKEDLEDEFARNARPDDSKKGAQSNTTALATLLKQDHDKHKAPSLKAPLTTPAKRSLSPTASLSLPRVPTFKCSLCDFIGTRGHEVEAHRLTHSMAKDELKMLQIQSPQFNCPLCSYSTPQSKNLTVHLRTHTH